MSSAVTFDVYQALEVTQGASQQEIKAAYRRLALAHHPDKNQNNAEATAKFQQIGAAYETLSDPARKADYDARSAFSSYPSSAASSPDRYQYSGSDSDDSFESYGFGRNNSFPFNFSFGGFSFVFGDGHQRQASEESEDDRELREFQERLQRQEKARKDRLAAARARADAEEAAVKAQKIAKEAEENSLNAQKMEKLKQERATQEKIWEKVNATTTAEKQANCQHTGFWPKEQQKRKFKCMECGQKRGMTAFKCPYCALMRAIELLYAKGRQGRPTTAHTAHLEGLPESANTIARATVKGKPSIYGLKEWLSELGHLPSDINKLNIIHVAGTKGKGSTCTFTSSFLAAHGQRTGFPRKIGLYTSPHLIHTEERIRINFQPISRDLFAKYYFEVEDLLSRPNPEKFHIRPRTLQVLTLLAFHVFIREGVDAAVFETHHGGEYDSTNVVEQPVVTAITSLGIDHINSLGPDLSSIAWHKGGIFKTGSVALSAPQDPEAADALRGRAREKGVELQFVNPVSELEDWDLPKDILQLKPDVQRVNASVALAATRAWLQAKCSPPDSHISSEDILKGVQEFSWPGRFQFENEREEKFQWFLDGAHNEMSVGKAAGWFREAADIIRTSDTAARILIYSSITVIRDAGAVFKELTTALVGSGINHVIFTTYDTGSPAVQPDVKKAPVGEDQHGEYAQTWKETHADSSVFFEPTIQGALVRARSIGNEHGGMQVLITGSLHLVGGALSLNLLRP